MLVDLSTISTILLIPMCFYLQSGILKDENTRLTTELREAREKIRNLEIQVESMKANARKAAQTLMDG